MATTIPGEIMSAAILRIIALAVALTAQAPLAQPYPSKPVRVVVPFAAGGPADIYARVIGEKLQAALGQAFVIENRPGGGAIVGTDAVAKSAPDGYTLLMMSNTHTVNESLFAEKPYVLLRDLAPVAPVNSSDLVMVVHPSVPAATLAEFIALAKAKPGGLNYASSGPGTPYHMAGELFKSMAAVDIVHVPYKGSSGARTDILGGQVHMMFDAITTMAPNVRAGKLKALGTSGRTRSAVLPEVPTLSEAGVPGYEAVIWLGVMAPAGTPRPIIERLNAEITRASNSAEMKEAWAKQGAVALSMTPEEFARFLRDDIEKWARIVKISGAKPDQ
jgi:tripartite-type tricarboxylate transporter receptor subunit TctC